MNALYAGAAFVLILNLGGGLLRVVLGPTPADRMVAAQLFGTTGVAILLLMAAVSGEDALRDAALVLVLLAVVISVAFVERGWIRTGEESGDESGDEPGDEPGDAPGEGGGVMTGAAWIPLVSDVLSGLLIVIGCFFFLAGTVGLLRFPDIYCRLHALTKADALGLGCIVAGLLPSTPGWSARLQLVLIWFLGLASAATVCHLLARSALGAGIAPLRTGDDEER